VTTIGAAPILAAFFLLALALLLRLRMPAWQVGKGDAARPRTLDRVASYRDTSGRLDLSIVELGDFHVTGAAARSTADVSAKRIVDVAAAIAVLVLLAPLAFLTAASIKIDSRGPVLYRQKRIGYDGRPFEILKFRSMVADAEKNGAQWAAVNDDRVTRVGKLIRKFRIDEIPQAINVLRGEMSIVGPRPERPEFVRLLETEIPNYHLRHMVRPGITGWAQVKYCYGASVEDARIKLQYDLYYIKHFSLQRDFMIMLMTFRVALFGLGR